MNVPQQPCGTPAAYRRHLRHGEKPCFECSTAERRRCHTSAVPGRTTDTREVRNGLPWKPYTYRGTGTDTLTREAT